MHNPLVWILASLSLALFAGAGVLWLLRMRKPDATPLPSEWTLTARPVFNADERRVYRQLREALPHHIVLSKLPLVRFCQPTDPREVRFWYELLGKIHVGFAICSANGRVLAAIDLDTDRASARRSLQIKQSVLAACRVRYLRCPVDHLPSIPELQLLVPHSGATARGPQPAPTAAKARNPLTGGSSPRGRDRTTLWQDSGFLQDSFFGTDNRMESSGVPSAFGGLHPPPGNGRATPRGRDGHDFREEPRAGFDDVGGVVVDTPPPTPLRH
jgi:hypothetical protein